MNIPNNIILACNYQTSVGELNEGIILDSVIDNGEPSFTIMDNIGNIVIRSVSDVTIANPDILFKYIIKN